MPQHNPASDATSAPHHEAQAGELHQARGQPTVSPTDHGEPPEAASTPANIETAAECPTPPSPASTQGSVAVQADQRRVCIRSDRLEQINVDLLIQAILIIAEDMETPPDRGDTALT